MRQPHFFIDGAAILKGGRMEQLVLTLFLLGIGLERPLERFLCEFIQVFSFSFID